MPWGACGACAHDAPAIAAAVAIATPANSPLRAIPTRRSINSSPDGCPDTAPCFAHFCMSHTGAECFSLRRGPDVRQAWRWYGPDDPVTLDHVRQAGAHEIVSALHQYAPGEAWPRAAVAERKALIENTPAGRAPLKWTVVESIPVPDDIQREGAAASAAIEAWIESMRAVAAEGIRTICYNVMPVVDWTRTDLDFPMPTGATALRFDYDRFVAFDLYIL